MSRITCSLSENSTNRKMFEEKAKLTRTRTVKNCLGKKKHTKRSNSNQCFFFRYWSCWVTGAALQQLSGVFTRSKCIIAMSIFVKSLCLTPTEVRTKSASITPESTLWHSNTLKFQILKVSAYYTFLILNSKFGKDAQISTPLKVFWPQCFHAILHSESLYYFSRDCKLRMRT